MEEDYIPVVPADSFQDLKEGDVFDLGGISVEIYACPGHTKGSLCMLVREERTLITGDACNTFTFLFAQNPETVTDIPSLLPDHSAVCKYSHLPDSCRPCQIPALPSHDPHGRESEAR